MILQSGRGHRLRRTLISVAAGAVLLGWLFTPTGQYAWNFNLALVQTLFGLPRDQAMAKASLIVPERFVTGRSGLATIQGLASLANEGRVSSSSLARWAKIQADTGNFVQVVHLYRLSDPVHRRALDPLAQPLLQANLMPNRQLKEFTRDRYLEYFDFFSDTVPAATRPEQRSHYRLNTNSNGEPCIEIICRPATDQRLFAITIPRIVPLGEWAELVLQSESPDRFAYQVTMTCDSDPRVRAQARPSRLKASHGLKNEWSLELAPLADITRVIVSAEGPAGMTLLFSDFVLKASGSAPSDERAGLFINHRRDAEDAEGRRGNTAGVAPALAGGPNRESHRLKPVPLLLHGFCFPLCNL